MSNYPGNGNQNGQVEEPLIQEVYEPEPDDYNYQPQLREVDEVELRNLSAIREETTVDTRVYKASALLLIAALLGGAVGYVSALSSASDAELKRKSSIAKVVRDTMEQKLKGLEDFEKDFAKIESGNFSEQSFNSVIPNYGKKGFMLDIASEVTSEVVLLANDPKANVNPLKGLREYSAATLLMSQLLSVHINETRADAETIAELQSKGDSQITFAMQVIPNSVYRLSTDDPAGMAPRSAYANGVIGIYTNSGAIEDENEAIREFQNIAEENRWNEWMRGMRTYKDPKTKNAAAEDAPEIPNRMIYRVTERNGNVKKLFADEVVLVDRQLLFGKSANAKERYVQRNEYIRAVLNEAKNASSKIISDLDEFIIKE